MSFSDEVPADVTRLTGCCGGNTDKLADKMSSAIDIQELLYNWITLPVQDRQSCCYRYFLFVNSTYYDILIVIKGQLLRPKSCNSS